MGFKSFKVVTFEQILGFDDGDSDGMTILLYTKDTVWYHLISTFIILIAEEWYRMLIIQNVGDGDGEFEGLKGGSRMMSLLTLFGGLKNVFKVSWTHYVRHHYSLNIAGEDIYNRHGGVQAAL